MSYPPLNGYGYQAAPSNRTQSDHTHTPHILNNPSVYPSQPHNHNDSHQTHHPVTSEWSNQAQQNGISSGSNLYSSDTWRNQQMSYGYHAQPGYEASGSSSSQYTSSYQGQGNERYGPSTQMLSRLAYASDLDAMSRSQPLNTKSNDVPTTHRATISTSISQSSTKISDTNSAHPARIHPVLPQSQYTTAYGLNSNSANIGVATALADAVRHRHANQQHAVAQPSSPRQHPSPVNPRTLQSTSRPSSASPHAAAFSTNHGRRLSSQAVESQRQSQVPNVANSPQREGPIIQRKFQMPTMSDSSLHNAGTAVDPANATRMEIHLDTEKPADVATQIPIYINPTQIFNQREYEQRKQREVEEIAASKRVQEQTRLGTTPTSEVSTGHQQVAHKQYEGEANVTMANSKSKVNRKSFTISAKSDAQYAPTSDPSEAKMATDLKELMEKMKGIRALDPSMFQRLWNEMRTKDQSTAAVSPAGTAPQASTRQDALHELPVQSTEPSAKVQRNLSHLNSDASGPPPNGYKVVVEDNDEGLPDRGRFPAERRIRQSYTKVAKAASNKATATEATVDPAPTKFPSPTVHSKDSTSAWSEQRRRAVTAAATQVLNSIPENADNQVNPEEIFALLAGSPSYLELCAALESKNLKFHRNTFARELLVRVPDLSATSSIKSTNTQSEVITNREQSASDAAIMSTPIISEIAESSLALFSNAQADIKAESAMTPAKSDAGRSTKLAETTSRKRDFAEIVDLTEIDNDENYVLPAPKQPRLELESATTHPPQVQDDRSLSASRPPFTGLFENTNPLKFDPRAAPTSIESINPPTASITAQPLQRLPKAKTILAKKLDKAEALQKTLYDPKTIARDVLIASGRHPTERPLNVHLAGLLNSYTEGDSDLSSLDWDSIDPGGPPPPKVGYEEVTVFPPRFKLGERVHGRKKLVWSPAKRLSRKGETRGAEKLPSPKLAAPLTPIPVSLPATASTATRQSLLDIERAEAAIKTLQPSRSHGLHNAPKLNVTQPLRQISIDIPPPGSRGAGSKTHGANATAHQKPMEQVTPAPKRRGRPPGSKNKHPSLASLRKQAASAGTKVVTVSEIPSTLSDPPTMHTYKCKWIRCRAELHNYATLQRHVVKNHITPARDESEREYVCWWKKCRLLQTDDEGGIEPSEVFDGERELLEHVEADHLQPVAFKFGDGPVTTHTDPHRVSLDRERYLSDEVGRSTTPAIGLDGGLHLPHDALELVRTYAYAPKTDKERADVKAQDAFFRVHGIGQHQRSRAEEIIRAMSVRKERIGPGIDRGGCTLINEARRSTFIQAPGIARVIEADY